jgi:hypothetical protein
MRFIVELHRTSADEIEGVVIPEGSVGPRPFSGWLELLRLLEDTEVRAEEE